MPHIAEWLSFVNSIVFPVFCLHRTAGATNPPGTIGFEFTREKRINSPAFSTRRNRRDPTSIFLSNEIQYYLINITIGTPGRTASLSLDTGSADIWFPHADTLICEDSGCGFYGGDLHTADSGTLVNATEHYGGNFNISYRDGTEVVGDYIFDTVDIGGMKVKNVTMGLASQVWDMPNVKGILGVGFVEDEAHYMGYPNLPVQLLQQGHINSVAYSVWLNDVDSTTGSILFGGVDTEKYRGDLITTPLHSTEDFYVELSSVNFTSSSGEQVYNATDLYATVLLDTGATRSTLPGNVVKRLRTEVGAIYNDYHQMWLAPCKSSTGGTIDFGFGSGNLSQGGPVVNVNVDEILYPYIDEDTGEPPIDDFGKELCRFGISAADEGGHLKLGDTFLRSAYVVYDLHNKHIALANTKFNSTTSNVQEITNSTFAELGAVKFQTFSAKTEPTQTTAAATVAGTKLTAATQTVSADDKAKSSTTNSATSTYALRQWLLVGGLLTTSLMKSL